MGDVGFGNLHRDIVVTLEAISSRRVVIPVPSSPQEKIDVSEVSQVGTDKCSKTVLYHFRTHITSAKNIGSCSITSLKIKVRVNSLFKNLAKAGH